MKSVLFCRVSSREQEQEGYSLPAQEKFLREYVERQQLRASKVFAVSESASGKAQRKIFNEMISYIRKKEISVVIVETTDRLTRNFADVPLIDKWILENDEHQIHLAKEGCILEKNSKSHEWFMWRVKVATAEYYVRLLSENVKKGQKEKIAQGWLPTKPPPGYTTVGEKGKKIHIIDEHTAPLIKKMFKFYRSGEYSIKRLTNRMHEEGLRTSNGKKVAKSRIHLLLKDPFYMGKIRWNDEIYDGSHEPIISKEVFQVVQKLMESKTTPKYNKHRFLFKGLVRCSECGGTITWEIQKVHVYGHCNHYRECAQSIWVKEPDIEEQLLRGFKALKVKSKRLAAWIRKALKEGHKDEIEYHESTLDELNGRYKQVQRRLDRLYDDKLDEKITQSFYDRKFKQYSKEKDEIADAIKKHSEASSQYLDLGVNIYEVSQRAKKIYMKAKRKKKLEKQRGLINFVFTNMTLNKGKLSFEYTKAFQVLSEAVQATNSSKVKNLPKNAERIFEPSKKDATSVKYAVLQPKRPFWLDRWDDFRTVQWSVVLDNSDVYVSKVQEVLR